MTVSPPQTLNWLGPWDDVTSYTADDLVTDGSASYICLADNTGIEPPNASFWQLLEPPAQDGLISIAEYKASRLISQSSVSGAYTDEELQAFINSETAYFQSQCYQPIAVVTETYPEQVGTIYASVDNQGALNIFPRFFPVAVVNSIKYRFDPAQAWSDAAAFATGEYTVQDFEHVTYSWGPVIRIPFANPFIRGQWGEVLLSYDAGYSTVPEDVKRAVILLVFKQAAANYAPVDPEGQTKSIIPGWVDDYITKTIQAYQRRF